MEASFPRWALALCALACTARPTPAVPERAAPTAVPQVPAAPQGEGEAVVAVRLEAHPAEIQLSPEVRYPAWTFNGRVPAPFVRARVGDVLEVHVSNKDPKMVHNADFHAVLGPGGGAVVLSAAPGEEKAGRFKLLYPGLFMYHCATPPVMDHIANGMYGAILVEPLNGLPHVDREFAVVQSEFYTAAAPDGGVAFSHAQGLLEHPSFVVFNGATDSMVGKTQLTARAGERIRIFFVNAGPNLVSSFHIIGSIFDRVYRDADLISPPARGVQTAMVPPGGATVVELQPLVPGSYMMVDHAIFRVEKGAAGFLEVSGAPRPDLYRALEPQPAAPPDGGP